MDVEINKNRVTEYMPLWHEGYLKLKTIEKKQIQEKFSVLSQCT